MLRVGVGDIQKSTQCHEIEDIQLTACLHYRPRWAESLQFDAHLCGGAFTLRHVSAHVGVALWVKVHNTTRRWCLTIVRELAVLAGMETG